MGVGIGAIQSPAWTLSCEPSRVLRIHKVGEHAVCHTCNQFKKQLATIRLPKDRQVLLEAYTEHVLKQWLSKQVYANTTSMSLECLRFLQMGERLCNLSFQVSQVFLAVDRIDQARFRVPRIFCKTRGLEKLISLALRIQCAQGARLR